MYYYIWIQLNTSIDENKQGSFLQIFTDGITNKLIACQLNTDPDSKNIVLVRIYGNKTDLLIDRNAELR